MRIALLHPPPWKIAPPGAAPAADGEGPPSGFRETDFDVDFFEIPYGLLSLAAQALHAGHAVKVLNLSSYPWPRVEAALAALKADVYGMTCFTANRRGVALVARKIRELHPRAHVVVGGAHATALAVEMLEHHREIDTVVLGEGEQTLLDIADRLRQGLSVIGLAGTAARDGERIVLGPVRPRIADLDRLASPHDYFDTHLVMTSRGCPGRCTFCAKNVVWGSKYRTQSVGHVLESLEKALARLPLKMLLIKDDTFTADRNRALAICNAIRERGLEFVWSCDTRADALDDELARAMRLAGCQRLSLGVESGSPAVLERIRKQISPATVVETTRIAKRYGLGVRFFMMLGNRGETRATFEESLALVETAQPHQSIFACLSVYPGTEDFRDLEAAGVLSRQVFFEQDFQELKMPFDASDEDTRLMSDWFYSHLGVQQHYRPSIDELAAILERLGDHHAAHLDLGDALCAAGRLDEAERHVQRALELGYPVPELAHNTLACIAAARGDSLAMQERLGRAMGGAPHRVVVHNVRAVGEWRARAGAAQGVAPRLLHGHGFELPEPPIQPLLPGPLPADLADWPGPDEIR